MASTCWCFKLFLFLQFAGTLSDGLGKTMDHRHQSEREYIRYHGATSGEHLVAGIHGLAHGKSLSPPSQKSGSIELLFFPAVFPFNCSEAEKAKNPLLQ